METYDTYCLVPQGALSGKMLEDLFVFTNVTYNDLEGDVDIESAGVALVVFHTRLSTGSASIRFDKSMVPQTSGGWLYRLYDGSAVVGLSGYASVSPEIFHSRLKEVIQGGICYTPGEQPPPDTRDEFIRLSHRQSKEPWWE